MKTLLLLFQQFSTYFCFRDDFFQNLGFIYIYKFVIKIGKRYSLTKTER
jgi:hypothetical protein